MTTGQRIKEARKKAGLTQAELADKLGVPYQSISQWERNTRNPKLETLRRIAGVLNISVIELTSDGFIDNPNDDLDQSWSKWLRLNGILFIGVEYLGEEGMFFSFESSNEYFFLTRDQAWQLPHNSLVIIKNLIKSMGKQLSGSEELTELPRYRASDAPQSTPDSTEGTDTTPQENASQEPAEGPQEKG